MGEYDKPEPFNKLEGWILVNRDINKPTVMYKGHLRGQYLMFRSKEIADRYVKQNRINVEVRKVDIFLAD